jgi:cobalamin biosynthesis protein CbiG
MQHSVQYLWLGLGCRRDTPEQLFASVISAFFAQYSVDAAAILGLATLSTKRTEVGLIAYCHAQRWPLLTFTPQELQQYAVPSPSAAVASAIGIPSVSEAAALRGAAQSSLSGKAPLLLIPKQVLGSVTLALAQSGS